MDGETRLFTGALEVVTYGATFSPGEGWQLRTRLRRQFEDWAEAESRFYEHMTTPELVDVLTAEVEHLGSINGL